MFPAHAGMDRAALQHQSRRRRVPRARGDGPLEGVRAWPSIQVFPAHAGMDRAATASTSGWRWCSPRTRGWTDGDPLMASDVESVPRARGDGPMLSRLDTILRNVFPAHAGMDRC